MLAWCSLWEGLRSGFRNWRAKLTSIRSSTTISGLERLFVVSIHFLHVITISGWLKIAFDPITDKPVEKERRLRDRVIEGYIVIELVVLQLILWLPDKINVFHCAIAGYILFEIVLNLSSIVFVGKLDVYPPTPSIERSLLLFGFNVIQVITVFAILYRFQFGQRPLVALIHAFLVFGTINHPLKEEFHRGYVVALQILTDFVLLAVFLGAFVGNLGAFKRRDK